MKRVYVSLIANFDRKSELQCVGVGFDNAVREPPRV